MGCTYISFFIQNGANFAQNPPRNKKKKYIFELLFGPFKNVMFCSFYAFPGGT